MSRLSLVLTLLTGLLAACSARADLRLVHSERSLYREVLVYENGDVRCMCFTRSCRVGRQSCINTRHPDRIVMSYPQMMLGALFVNPAPRSVLIVGLGGGTLPRALRQMLLDVHIDVVEIDPAVVRVANRYFQFAADASTRVFESDGRVYVKRAQRSGQRYDLIMLDAFDHEYIPEHLLTQEFLEEVKSLLTPDGVLAANTFSSSRLYDYESVTYEKVFAKFFNLKRENRVIIARLGALPDPAQLRANSEHFVAAFNSFGFNVNEVLPLFTQERDWNPRARVLTDQYSPANLLNLDR
ncbi:MAG TPA: fused MFS/spermidine synthase [Steroidobacteraceae bacterium]|nr:fused MFS/spermidine synthase [Steroidobacteraceae bacterium]